MSKITQLLAKKIFRNSDAASVGIAKQYLHELSEEGRVRKIGPDVYCDPRLELPEDKLQWIAACKIFGKKAYISGPTKLFSENLLDQPPHALWIIAEQNKTTSNGQFQLIRTKIDKKIGVENHTWYRVASIERALLDCLNFQAKLGGTGMAIRAIKAATKDGQTDLSSIMKMAKKLGWQKKLLSIWEAISID